MPTEVTRLLDDFRREAGDEQAETLDKLLPVVYGELKKLAASFLRREHAVSIQTTELVHEAYFRLTKQRNVDWQNRGQFFAIAAQAMRRILIDAARQRRTARRDGVKIYLDDSPSISVEMDENLLDLDLALNELRELDERQSQIVELRYFGGLTVEQTAELLKMSPTTVKREWTVARAWLYDRINGL